MVSDKIQKISQRAELAKLTKLLQLRSSVTGRKDQDTRIKISAFLRERMFSRKLRKYWIIFTVNIVIPASPHNFRWPT